MITNQIEVLAELLKNKDMQEYSGDAFWNLIQCVVMGDPAASLSAIKNIKDLIFHTPTIIFWGKMKRYLEGTFHDYNEQVKMARKFSPNNKDYEKFIKHLIQQIDVFQEDAKIDYFSNLSRCFLLTDLKESLFFKIVHFITYCTTYELEFIKEKPKDFESKNTAIVSSLYKYGLMEQEIRKPNNDTVYVFTSFGKALKSKCLNFNDDLLFQEDKEYQDYDDLLRIGIPEAMTFKDIDDLFNE